MRNVVHEGGPDDVMPWTNNTAAAVVSGQALRVGHQIVVALVDIPIGATGSVAVGGVVSGVPKNNTRAWGQCDKLVWDASASNFDTTAATLAAGDLTGGCFAWLAALAGDTTGTIKLTPGNNTLT